MPKTYVVDFETYYAKDYHMRQKGMTYIKYILNPQFLVHGMSVDDGKTSYWVDGPDVAAWLEAHSGDILVAHNGFFDFAVMKWHYKFTPAYMIDTVLLANHVFGSSRDRGGEANDLASLATRLGLKPKGKVEFMRGVRVPNEEQKAALVAYATNDASLGRQVLSRLMPQVSNPDFELWLLDHTMRIYTERSLQIDVTKMEETIAYVTKRQADIIEQAGVPKPVLASDKKFAEHFKAVLEQHKIKPPMKKAAKPRKDGTQPMIPALSKNDPGFYKLAEHENPDIAKLVQARLVVRSAATITARLATMREYAKLGIGIPVHLVYYGAHTGRFSGGGGFNFQNLTSPDRAQNEIDRLLAQAVRQIIIPGDGWVFVAVDAAQIEARVLAWLAGQQDILDAFAAGADLYSAFISGVLGKDVHKPTKDEEKADPKHAQWLKLMRQMGKESILGLGYSMGVDKFFDSLPKKSKDLGKMIDRGELTKDFAAEVVRAYRDRYTDIVDYWGKLERAFHRARMGAVAKLGPITFKRVGYNAVAVVLPSGRMLYYRNIRQEGYKGRSHITGLNGQQRQTYGKPEWKHGAGQKIYGGLLAENITQAVARDILAENGILASEQAGYPVALHIHDEVVARVPEAKGSEALEFLIKSLSTSPPWGKGMVLSAEGKIGKNLGK